MGRVETRMYKRRRKRARTVRLMLLLGLVVVAVVLAARRLPEGFISERISLPTTTPLTSTFDQTVETREVTLAAETWYAIQTGVFSTQEAALQKADMYADRGAPGTVVKQGEKWRVFIACYGTEKEASAVRTRLETNQKVDTYLYAWECPELRLRLTAKAGLLDAVEAGFTLITSTAAALRETATNLDAAQLTTQEAAQAVAELDGQIELWEETVHQRFGKSIPALVQEMLDITGNWDARYSALRACADVTALSAELKSQAMGLFDEMIMWRTKLSAQ